MEDGYIVIASWQDQDSDKIQIQDFVDEAGSFIPMFSDKALFLRAVADTDFAHKGVFMARKLLLSILKGDETLVIDPGTSDPQRLNVADFAQLGPNHAASD